MNVSVPINYLAVIVAAAVNYAIGSLWYGVLFAKSWMKLTGMKEMKVTAVSVVVALVGAFFTSWILAHSLVFAGAFMKTSGIGLGLTTGFFNWLGYIAPVTIGVVIYEKKPFSLWILTNAYWLISLLVMGIILAYWT
jgi:hypothetical protein